MASWNWPIAAKLLAEIDAGVRIVGLDLQDPPKLAYRLLQPTAPGQDSAEFVAGQGAGRLGLHGTLELGDELVVVVSKILIGPL